jgi:hypothetical protein
VLSGSDLYVGLITRPEESIPIVMCLSVISKPQQWGGLVLIYYKYKSAVADLAVLRVCTCMLLNICHIEKCLVVENFITCIFTVYFVSSFCLCLVVIIITTDFSLHFICSSSFVAHVRA